MAKRFTDTLLWNKEWFLKLNPTQKLLIKFLFDNCDCAGIYETNLTLLSFYIGATITEEDFKELKQVKKLPNGNYMIEDFIQFQYGVSIDELNPKFSVHKGIIKQLEKNNVSVNQPLTNPCVRVEQTLQDMDMVMDKDNISHNVIEEEKEIKKEKEERICLRVHTGNTDLLYNPNIKKVFDIYKQNCTYLIPIRFEKRNVEFLGMLAKFLEQIEYDFDYFEGVCVKANKLKKIVKTKIDLKMLINNHERISSGFYDTGQKETQEEFIERMRREMSND